MHLAAAYQREVVLLCQIEIKRRDDKGRISQANVKWRRTSESDSGIPGDELANLGRLSSLMKTYKSDDRVTAVWDCPNIGDGARSRRCPNRPMARISTGANRQSAAAHKSRT
jgi:hypothetical protein